MDAHISDTHRSASAPGGRQSPVTPAQVIALGLVAASIGWAAWLLRDRPATGETELLSGMVLPAPELAVIEAAFDRAKLADYRTEGGRVFVPRARHGAYMRAVVDAEALPREFGGSLRRALAANSPWQSRSVQAGLLRAATQEELALVIRSMPGIERAAVLYDVEERPALDSGLRGGPAKTASVNVRTLPDTELDPARVMAIRVLVASAIAGLPPERVAVTDLRSGRVFSGPLDQERAIAATDPVLDRSMAHERHLAAKLRQALSFVKGAIIDVAVGFGRPPVVAVPEPPPVPRIAAANTPLEIAAPAGEVAAASAPRPADDAPSTVHVSVAVPDSYFDAVARAAAARGATALLPGDVPGIGGSAQDVAAVESDRIRRIVLELIPATADPDGTRVVVTGFPTVHDAEARRELGGDAPAEAAVNAAAAGGRAAAFSLAGLIRSLRDESGGLRLEALDELPREAWLAATSVCVGLLAGILWWSGSRSPTAPRRRKPTHRRGAQPPIDWSGIDADPTAGLDGEGPVDRDDRNRSRIAA